MVKLVRGNEITRTRRESRSVLARRQSSQGVVTNNEWKEVNWAGQGNVGSSAGKDGQKKHNKDCHTHTYITTTTLYNYYNIIFLYIFAADVDAHGPDCAQSSGYGARGVYQRLFLRLY